jgi:hypothetical protein
MSAVLSSFDCGIFPLVPEPEKSSGWQGFDHLEQDAAMSLRELRRAVIFFLPAFPPQQIDRRPLGYNDARS